MSHWRLGLCTGVSRIGLATCPWRTLKSVAGNVSNVCSLGLANGFESSLGSRCISGFAFPKFRRRVPLCEILKMKRVQPPSRVFPRMLGIAQCKLCSSWKMQRSHKEQPGFNECEWLDTSPLAEEDVLQRKGQPYCKHTLPKQQLPSFSWFESHPWMTYADVQSSRSMRHGRGA